MSTRELETSLQTTVTSKVIYPAMLFDLKFGGYAPPVPLQQGESIAWAFPTTVQAGPKDAGATNGSASGTLQGGRITFTQGYPLGNYFWYVRWGGFSAVVPENVTVTAIYAVLIVSRKNGATYQIAAAGPDVNFSFAWLEPGSGGQYIALPGGFDYPATQAHSPSLGTDVGILNSSTIVATLGRSLSGDLNEEFTITGVGFAIYYQGDSPAGVQPLPDGGNVYHVWSGIGTLVVNGTSYVGVGSLGTVSTISEGTGVEAKGITLTLSGLDPTWLTMSMTEINLASRAKVWLAFLDPNATSNDTLVIGSPLLLYTGILDGPKIDIDTNTAAISIDVESKMVDLNRARGGRLTDQDQQARYPGDNSLQYVSYNADRQIFWRT